MFHRLSKILWAAPLLGLSMALAAFAPAPASSTTRLNALDITNQSIGGNANVRVAEVFSENPSWIVIHADQGHGAGPIIGWTRIPAGENLNVHIKLNLPPTLEASGLYAVLHADRGTRGRFEYPGPDAPTMDPQGRMVIDRFQLGVQPE